MSDAFPQNLREAKDRWATLRTGQKKFIILTYIGFTILLSVAVHLGIWASELWVKEPLHHVSEIFPWYFYVLWVGQLVAFVLYMESSARKGRKKNDE